MFDADRKTPAASGFHLGLGELKHVHGIDTGLGRQDPLLLDLSCSRKYGAYCCRDPGALAHPLSSRRHRENVSVLPAVLVSLDHNLETTHRLVNLSLLQQSLPLRKYEDDGKFQRNNPVTMYLDRLLIGDAQSDHSLYQLGISRRQHQPEVGYSLQALQVLRQGYGLGMRIAIDTVSTDILKLCLLFQCLSAILEEVDRGKFAIEKHRYAYLHRMDSVLHHRRPLNLFAAMGMIYIHRLNLVKQRISTEPDQNISHAGRAPHPDER